MKTKISEINLLYCPWIYHSKIITSCSLREGVACTDTFHCDQQLWDAVDKELQPSLLHRTASTDRRRNRARWRSRRLLHGFQLGAKDKTALALPGAIRATTTQDENKKLSFMTLFKNWHIKWKHKLKQLLGRKGKGRLWFGFTPAGSSA